MIASVLVAVLAEPASVAREPDPAAANGLYALAPMVVLILVFFGFLLARRRRRPEGADRSRGFMAKLSPSTGLGNALVEINAMFDPSRAAVVMTMEPGDTKRDPMEVDDERDPAGPEPEPVPESSEADQRKNSSVTSPKQGMSSNIE